MNTLTLIAPSGEQSIPFLPGETLLAALRRAGLAPDAPCGGRGTCGKCRVTLREPDGSERTVSACAVSARDDMIVLAPERADMDVLQPAAAPFEERRTSGAVYAAADIGTTTVACLLTDGEGRVLDSVGEGSAQSAFGADVIARIQAAAGEQTALTAAVRTQLARMLSTLCARRGLSPETPGGMAVAGNTTMLHLLAGLSPESIGVAPYRPLSRFGAEVPAGELGLPLRGKVYLCPAVSGYVGGDITADLLALDADRWEKPALLVDVGTNGEMAIGCGKRFVCCAAAAGPAFEGAQIACGMTAAPGAVTAVTLCDGALGVEVYGGGPARGLCGSGLMDAAAVMLELGAMLPDGRILNPERDELPPAARPYLTLRDGKPVFVLAPEVYVTQKDIRSLQLGKAAIAAGIALLLDEWTARGGKRPETLLLAGGFGSHLRPESAARIGMIPAFLLPGARAVGNTAALGAALAAPSDANRARLAALAEHMDYVELAELPAFNDRFVEEMGFPI